MTDATGSRVRITPPATNQSPFSCPRMEEVGPTYGKWETRIIYAVVIACYVAFVALGVWVIVA